MKKNITSNFCYLLLLMLFAFSNIVVALPTGYKELPSPKGVKFKFVDVGTGGDSPQVVAIDTGGKVWQMNDDWKGWKSIHSAFAAEVDDIPDGSTVAVWSHDEGNYLITTYKGWLFEADTGNPNQHNAKLKVRRIGKWFAFERWDGKRLEYAHDDDEDESIQGFRRKIAHNLSERRCYYILVKPDRALNEYDQRISTGALNNVAIKSVYKPSHFWSETSGATSLWNVNDEHPAEYEDARFRIHILSKGDAHKPPTAMGSVSIGVDGTVWGVSTDDGTDGRVWRKKNRDAGWEQVPGPGKFVGVGRGSKVWVSNETVYERQHAESGDRKVLYDPANWVNRGGSGIAGMGCLEDGTGFHYDSGGGLYMYNRGWKPVQHPAKKLACVAGKTRAEMVVVDQSGKAWCYSKKFDAKSKKFKSSWTEAFTGLSMLHAAVGQDGTLVGITKDHKLVVKKVSAAEMERKRWMTSEKGQGQGELKKIRNETDFPIQLIPLEDVVPPKESFDSMDLILFRPLSLKGYAKDAVIKGFDASKTLNLAPMLSQGFAWISQALKTPGKTTISFVAKARDDGNVQLVLDSKAGIKADLKIIIGTQNNSKSVIMLNGKEVAHSVAKHTPYAKAMPGRNVPYSVSINGDFIMVSAEQPGQNVFLCGYVPDVAEFTRFGFSSNKGAVDYSELQVGQAYASRLVETDDLYKYEKAVSVSVSGKDKVTWVKEFPMRLPNEGTMIFTVPGKETVKVVLANEQGDAYELLFDRAKNKIVLMRKSAVVAVCNTPPIGEQLWVSLDSGKVLAGQSTAGEELLMMWEDQEMLPDIVKTGFMQAGGVYSVKSIGIGPSVPIAPDVPGGSYKAKIKRYPAKGDIQVLRPWHYVLTQKKLLVNIKDMISGRDFDAFQTSMTKGIYPFLLTMEEDGFPVIEPTADPQNKELKALDSAADRKQMKADRTTRVSQTIGDGVANATAGAADLGPKGAAVAAVGQAVGAIAGTVGSLLAAGDQEKAEKMRKKAAEMAATRDMYVRLDKVERDAAGGSSVPPEVKENKNRVEGLMKDAEEYIDDMPALKPEDIAAFAKLFKEIMQYINHHFVLSDALVKKRVHEGLNRLSQKLQKDEENEIYYDDVTYIRLMNLFAQAYSNAYLVDKSKDTEVDMQEEWYFAMVDTSDLLFRDMLEKKDKTLNIGPLNGEYLWLPMVFKDGNVGAFGLEVKSQGDFMVCFSESDERVRGTDVFLYEFVLGAYDNSEHVLRVKSLGRSAASLSKKKDRKAMLAAGRFKRYDFVMNKENLSIRHKGEKILGWKDPYPWGGIEFIGISTWQTPVTIKGFDFKKCINIDDVEEEEDDEDWWGDE